MRLLFAAAIAAVLGLSLSACNLVFKLPTRQGNVIEQKQLDQLKLGMTREQVTYLLGTPVAASPFRTDRWDYVGYYKSPRGQVSSRTITLYFNGDALSQMDGVEASESTATPKADAAAIFKAEQKDQNEAERSADAKASDVIQTTPPNAP